ncbi:hypothetical protein LCO01nite_14860 [Lapidilactobacillus concavus]|uniref:single-stranded DNA-binding protein n=1 Tax=Lapidilactobacillus concavus TaxID=287844 RepID=UPI000708E3C7|nr:single-stranded DNA-binding protein [Lapidilactobacillus concavus]GEL13937.1 hypothetical protein LCO01nite_14860 [Lapidilactobacillus concavus]
MNDIKILGRLAADPELRTSDSSKRSYVWFTVAVPRHSDHSKADFVRCVAFDKLAESLTQYCVKGRQVLVNGRLEVSQKINPESRDSQIYYSVISESIEFLQRPQTAGSQTESA